MDSASSRPNVVTAMPDTMADVVAMQVSVRELKTHLSAWLARAQSGEVLEVTSHRRPIARITAVRSTDPGTTHPLQAAMDAGLVSWSGQQPAFPPPIRLSGVGKSVSEMVLEDRGPG